VPLTESELERLEKAAAGAGVQLDELPQVPLAAGAVPSLDHLGPGRHLVWAVVAPPKW
jgi:hypothetical protein